MQIQLHSNPSACLLQEKSRKMLTVYSMLLAPQRLLIHCRRCWVCMAVKVNQMPRTVSITAQTTTRSSTNPASSRRNASFSSLQQN